MTDGLDVVYKRKREVKNDSKVFGLNQMDKKKCHLLRCRTWGYRHVLGEYNHQEPFWPCY